MKIPTWTVWADLEICRDIEAFAAVLENLLIILRALVEIQGKATTKCLLTDEAVKDCEIDKIMASLDLQAFYGPAAMFHVIWVNLSVQIFDLITFFSSQHHSEPLAMGWQFSCLLSRKFSIPVKCFSWKCCAIRTATSNTIFGTTWTQRGCWKSTRTHKLTFSKLTMDCST